MSDQPVAETSIYTGKHNRQTSMPSAGFEPAILATKRPQIYAFDRAAIVIITGLQYTTHDSRTVCTRYTPQKDTSVPVRKQTTQLQSNGVRYQF
jgi:hypothetical protein